MPSVSTQHRRIEQQQVQQQNELAQSTISIGTSPSLVSLTLLQFSPKLRKYRGLSLAELKKLILQLVQSGLSAEALERLYPLGGQNVSDALRSIRRSDPPAPGTELADDLATAAASLQ